MPSNSISGALGSKVASRDDARAVAQSMFRGKSRSSLFDQAAESVLVELILALHHAMPGEWRLESLAAATESLQTIESLLKSTDSGRLIFNRYFLGYHSMMHINIALLLRSCFHN